MNCSLRGSGASGQLKIHGVSTSCSLRIPDGCSHPRQLAKRTCSPRLHYLPVCDAQYSHSVCPSISSIYIIHDERDNVFIHPALVMLFSGRIAHQSDKCHMVPQKSASGRSPFNLREARFWTPRRRADRILNYFLVAVHLSESPYRSRYRCSFGTPFSLKVYPRS